MKYSGFTGFCRVLAPHDFPVGASDKEPTCQCRRHETWVQSPCREDPLEEGMATHSRILSWRIPMDRGAWWARVHSITTSWTQLKRLSLHTQADLKHLLMKITSVDTQMAYMTCDEMCLTGWDTAATWVNSSLLRYLWYLWSIINFLFSLSFPFYKHWLFLLLKGKIKLSPQHSPHPLRAKKAHSRGLSYK